LVETDSFLQMPDRERLLAHRRARSMVGDRGLMPLDVVAAVVYLASPLSDMVQGQTLVVEGGSSIHP
jgi:enoyl-[acyl-carrier protein] reductase III